MNGKYKEKNNHAKKGLVVWLTGLPCSGKTTLSKEIEKYFSNKEMPVQVLDGDLLRKTINKDLGFSKADRDTNIERVTYLAQMLSENGVNVVVAFVSPYEKMRSFARKMCPNFMEVYVKCDIGQCIKRDVKGMYKKALSGEIKDFTGVQDPYEEPKNPEIVLETDRHSLEESTEKLINFIKTVR